MKKIKFLIFGLLLLSIFSSCSKTEERKFATTINLKRIKPEIENAYYGLYPSIEFIQDSIMLISDIHNAKKVFSVLSVNDFHYITSTGKRGKGPNEINIPGYIFYNKKAKLFYILDLGKYKFHKFNMKSVLKNNDYLPESSFSFYEKYMPLRNVKMFSDSLIIFNGNTGKEILYVMNQSGKIVNKIGEKFYEKSENISDIAYAQATATVFDVNPDNTKFVIAYNLFDRLVCLDVEGNKLFEYKGSNSFEKNFKFFKGPILHYDGLKVGYEKIIATNNYIFALYNGEIGFYRKDNVVYNNYSKTIRVFDWEGNRVTQIKLDKEVYDFIIDKERNRIIACESKSEKPFVIYEFPKELIKK